MTLEEYMRELILMDKQYGQEEELYPLINMLLRESIKENIKENKKKNIIKKDLSVRDVHDSRASGIKHSMLYGYAAFPDLVILDEKCDLKSMKSLKEATDDQAGRMYGCVEAKVINGKLIVIQNGDNKLKLKYNDTVLIAKDGNNGKEAQYHILFDKPKNKNDEKKEKVLDNYLKEYIRYKKYSKKVINAFFEVYEAPEVSECKDAKFTQNHLKALEECKTADDINNLINNEKGWYLRIERELLCTDISASNKDIKELIGELLWYGKVLYTNGIVWKYLELKNPDKDTIRDKLSKFVGKGDAKWIKKLVGKKNMFPITVMCVEIGNLSEAYEELVTKVEKDKLVKLKERFDPKDKDEDVQNWEKKWNQLKTKLSLINWSDKNNTYDQFITK